MKKQITIISGHYGSGKSEVAINLAILNNINMIIDLDIVNPYFRSREVEEVLKNYNIELVSSPLKNALGSDLPFLSGRIFAPFHNKNIKAIYDLGGDGVGAKVFRQFDDFSKDGVDHFMVVNIYRDQTSSKDKIIKCINQIEGASGVKITGLINNSNLLKETTEENILMGQNILLEVAKETKLPIVFTMVKEGIKVNKEKINNKTVSLKIFLRKDWL